MSLENIYSRFLAAPKREVLDDSASFRYITTAISVNGPEEIIKQLTRENLKQLKKRVEKVITSFETSNSLVVEIETEIEFLTSGANWLPGLDDNFLADHVVRFPVVHIVNFHNGLIKEARLYWDQSNILKQLNVIGRTGRNWPIKDGAEQITLIADSVSHQAAPHKGTHQAPEETDRPLSKGVPNAMRDPHASLHLFSGEDGPPPNEQTHSSRSSSAFRPPSRDLIGGGQDEPPKPHPYPRARGSFSQGQTFDLAEHREGEVDSGRGYSQRNTNPNNSNKYSNFGDGEGEQTSRPTSKSQTTGQGKHSQSRNYETPEKIPRGRQGDARHNEDEYQENSRQPAQKPLSNVTNALSNAHRNERSQFEIADNSPSGNSQKREQDRPGKGDRNKSGYQWTTHQNAQDDDNGFFGGFGKETQTRGIRIAGNGQGQSKSVGKNWSWDQDSPSAGSKPDNVPAKAQGSRHESKQTQQEDERGFWDY